MEKFTWNHVDQCWYGPDMAPADQVDYVARFTKLVGTDTISSFEVTATGATVDNSVQSENDIVVWLSQAIVDTVVEVSVKVVTVGGRTFNRRFKVNVRKI